MVSSSLGIGVVGLGFMGRTHLGAYLAAARAGMDCRVVALCDADAERMALAGDISGNIPGLVGGDVGSALREVRRYPDVDDLLADDAVGAVSICTPTDSHVALAERALRAGKHVLVEKPVALRSEDVARLATVSASSGRVCMPAFCMRYWPGWDWLRDVIRDGRYGALRSVRLERLGGVPGWAAAFYTDFERSGGPLFDLHIHDADFLCWAVGRPRAVRSAGTVEHLTTLYDVPGGPAHVVAEGGWVRSPGFSFRMRYMVMFEEAYAEYDSRRASPLWLWRGVEAEAVKLEGGTGYEREIADFVVCALGAGGGCPRATLDDALVATRVLEAERESLADGGSVRLA